MKELIENVSTAPPISSEQLIDVVIEINRLREELASSEDDSDSEGTVVRVPIKPLPHSNSGAIALPKPDKIEG